jgi:hypothetical protein
MNNDLMQKLAMSKKIMDASDNIKPGQSGAGLPMTENVNATYNIPPNMIQQSSPQQMSQPQPVTEDRIQNSKLPDEIKQLMMEHPIQQPGFGAGGPVLSNDIIEGAQRLMGNNQKSSVNETKTTNSVTHQTTIRTSNK